MKSYFSYKVCYQVSNTMTSRQSSKFVKTVRGLPFPDLPWFTEVNLIGSLDYVPHDGDIVIASYPKTGTTWLQYIVHQITSRGQKPPSMEVMTYRIIPLVDMAGVEVIESLTEPRIYKHHLPYSATRRNPNCKYLYIHRNPEDVMVSYYHFMQNLMEQELDFDEFFEGFMTGHIGYGRYFEHVLSYMDVENVLRISYKNLRSNRKDEVLRIAKFIGQSHFEDIVNDGSVLERILEHTSFDYMKKNISFTHPMPKITENSTVLKDLDKVKTVDFFRKGEVGEGKKALTSNQLKRMSELMKQIMKDTDFVDEWQDHQK
ncbi:hypothetical protein JTE90_001590 [Oedothorax gibbosus]|uniref:Sulfotransferase domain-containing protein n=1 Tax=Oedothorax gibbosus TaxID=931172 RepID=A0AAV6VND9_9ARAC|nr:hypothetical protein JTE90_001590 [Oedothorax gibbosus]